ncbi:MAG TPA: response regulator [Pseudomonadales bacterium]
MTHVLIVEDEPDLAALMQDYLQAQGFACTIIGNGYQVDKWLASHHTDCILLDLMLPGKDGLSVCRDVRRHSEVPIIITTAKVEEMDRLQGLESGADDYVCKPYSPREVIARIRAILRRTNHQHTSSIAGLSILPDQLKVLLNEQDIGLTTVEFKLFQLLHDKVGSIFTREQIIRNIYSDHRVVSNRTVDSHVKKIRKKIHQVDPAREIIHAVYGAGYKVDDL